MKLIKLEIMRVYIFKITASILCGHVDVSPTDGLLQFKVMRGNTPLFIV